MNQFDSYKYNNFISMNIDNGIRKSKKTRKFNG